ncbi:MAG TPA: NAD-dependent epimerase/dehydratase family protein [Arachidicoccus sp.]
MNSNQRSKIVIIGASGTIGKKVGKSLEEKGYEIIRVSRRSGDFQADIQDKQSLENMFKAIGKFDAVANCRRRSGIRSSRTTHR